MRDFSGTSALEKDKERQVYSLINNGLIVDPKQLYTNPNVVP